MARCGGFLERRSNGHDGVGGGGVQGGLRGMPQEGLAIQQQLLFGRAHAYRCRRRPARRFRYSFSCLC